MESAFLDGSIWGSLFLAFKYLFIAIPIFLPIFLLITLFNNWISYKQLEFVKSKGAILLEIKLPREIFKSPLAMELVLASLSQPGGESTWIDRIWEGKTRAYFSLELVSLGGKVKFFIWTRPEFKGIIETQIYAQYPGVEVYEAEDYTLPFSYNPEVNNVWGFELALTKPDPYPIKTYVDYGLDRDPKEEYKIDPMTSMLEFLGSLTEGHNAFIQIFIRAHKKSRKWGVFSEQDDAWKDQAAVEMKKIISQFRPEEKDRQSRQATEGERDTITALERSISKLPYDCGIRCIYLANKDVYNGSNQGGLLGSWKQYGSQNLNGFKPTGWFTIFDYPWQDPKGKKKETFKKRIVEEYKMRSYFLSNYRGKKFYSKPFVLNSEELATIYHFPGLVAATPTFERIPSKKAEAPSNLPR